MRTNPGGQIDLPNIIGRDELAKRLWEDLTQQSLLMTAERRIGKTTLLKKMLAECPPGWFAVYMDLEEAHSAEEFAYQVYTEIQQFLSRQKKVTNLVSKWLTDNDIKLGVLELQKRPHTWKDLLRRAIEDLIAQQTPNRLVFFWDEMPYMLGNIRKSSDAATAMQVLDVLRAVRHSHPEFRMVLTGSLGMHHVLQELRQEHPGNEPLNDLLKIEVAPLDPTYSRELAKSLIQGESVACSNPDKAAELISAHADHVPFYIHHIVHGLKFDGKPAEPAEIEAIVSRHMTEANNPWELEHYRSRIADYYSPTDGPLVEHILDEVALAEQPLSINELIERLKAHGEFDDRKQILNLLRLMELDHYLQRRGDGKYEFRFGLIKRWWKLAQGLT